MILTLDKKKQELKTIELFADRPVTCWQWRRHSHIKHYDQGDQQHPQDGDVCVHGDQNVGDPAHHHQRGSPRAKMVQHCVWLDKPQSPVCYLLAVDLPNG